jgi:hypothetical protein
VSKSAGNLLLVLDPVAEAIYESIFDEPLGPAGTVERALYRQAAEAGLRAGMTVFATVRRSPEGEMK